MNGPFDAAKYWRERLAARPDLSGTGTSFLPEAWQRWLYRSKERTHRTLLRDHGILLAGARVLDFGCGTGFFESVWESAGALRADGVDIVPDVVTRLAAAHPKRRYVACDLAANPAGLDDLDAYDLVTAIDVLYHVVDDEAFATVVRALSKRIARGGHFLFSDALRDDRPAPHVRFRSLAQWEQILASAGLTIVGREAVAVVHNRPSVFARFLPNAVGAVQYYADRIATRRFPGWANNWALLARLR